MLWHLKDSKLRQLWVHFAFLLGAIRKGMASQRALELSSPSWAQLPSWSWIDSQRKTQQKALNQISMVPLQMDLSHGSGRSHAGFKVKLSCGLRGQHRKLQMTVLTSIATSGPKALSRVSPLWGMGMLWCPVFEPLGKVVLGHRGDSEGWFYFFTSHVILNRAYGFCKPQFANLWTKE